MVVAAARVRRRTSSKGMATRCTPKMAVVSNEKDRNPGSVVDSTALLSTVTVTVLAAATAAAAAAASARIVCVTARGEAQTQWLRPQADGTSRHVLRCARHVSRSANPATLEAISRRTARRGASSH
jgi:hypothetical protein